jgi:hypothetical protein
MIEARPETAPHTLDAWPPPARRSPRAPAGRLLAQGMGRIGLALLVASGLVGWLIILALTWCYAFAWRGLC